jgi:hypothetical protein
MKHDEYNTNSKNPSSDILPVAGPPAGAGEPGTAPVPPPAPNGHDLSGPPSSPMATPAAPAARLVPDLDEAHAFLRFLEPLPIGQFEKNNEGFVFQTYDDDKERQKHIIGRNFYAKTKTGWGVFQELEEANNDRCAIHVTINHSKARRRRAEDIDRVRKHFVEIDGSKTLEEILAMELKPAWINESSPGEFHIYFNVADDEASDLEGFRPRQQRLAALYDAGRESCDLSRVLRLPGFYHQKDPAKPFMVRKVYSDPDAPAYTIADLEKVLAGIPVPPASKTRTRDSGRSADCIADLPDDVQSFPMRPQDQDDARQFLVTRAPVSMAYTPNPDCGGLQGNAVAYWVACAVRDYVIDAVTCRDLMLRFWNDRCLGDKDKHKPIPLDPEGMPGPDAPKWPWDEDELESIVCHAYQYAENDLADMDGAADFKDLPDEGAPPDRGEGRTKVEISAGRLNEAVSKCQQVLGAEFARRDPVFQRGASCLPISKKYKYEESALLVTHVIKPWLMSRLERSIEFYGRSAGATPKSVRKDAPEKLADRLMADNTNWPAIRTLHATIEAPTLRDDGTILSAPGFDESSGLYFDPSSTEFPEISDNPTREDGAAAMALVAETLDDFPFEDGISRAVGLAAVLTGVVRRTLPTAPAFAFDADDAEAGKTTLAKLVGALVTGRDVAPHPLAGNEDERRKAFTTYLEGGSPVLIFDNVTGTIGDPVLEAILTSSGFSDRRLGVHGQIDVPTCSLFIFTRPFNSEVQHADF